MKKNTIKTIALLFIALSTIAGISGCSKASEKCKLCTGKIECGECIYNGSSSGILCTNGINVSFYNVAKGTCYGTWHVTSSKDTSIQICSTSSTDLNSQAQTYTSNGFTCVDK